MVAVEHVIVAMKPLDGNYVENALKHGVAGLWIDGCRVATSKSDFAKLAAGVEAIRRRGGVMNNSWKNASDLSGANPASPLGRWPANVILGHSQKCLRLGTKTVKGTGAKDNRGQPHSKYRFQGEGTVRSDVWTGPVDGDGNEVIENWDCVESCPVKLIGEQSGQTRGSGPRVAVRGGHKFGGDKGQNDSLVGMWHGDTGTAARFFKQVGEYDEDNG